MAALGFLLLTVWRALPLLVVLTSTAGRMARNTFAVQGSTLPLAFRAGFSL